MRETLPAIFGKKTRTINTIPMLYFNKSCRNCNTSDGIASTILDYYEDPNFKTVSTDYEISLSIAESLKQNQIKCDFCGAENFDIYKIIFDEDPIFEVDTLKLIARRNKSYLYIYNAKKKSESREIY